MQMRSCHKHPREINRELEIPQQATSAVIMILLVQRKLANLADIPSASSLPSEEQYSKCTSLVPRPLVCVF